MEPIDWESRVDVERFSIPNHGIKELAKMSEYLTQRFLCDVCIKATSDNTKLYAHRLVLSAGSQYFCNFLKRNSCEVVNIKDVSGVVLSSIVNFIYTGQIELWWDVGEILKFSTIFQMPHLTILCQKYISLTIERDTLWNCKNYVFQYGCEVLKQEIDRHISVNFMKSYKSKEFLKEMNVDDMKRILSHDSLPCDSEENVFDAVVHWVRFNPEEREPQLMQLVPCIRLLLLSKTFIIEKMDAFVGCEEAYRHCAMAIKVLTLRRDEIGNELEYFKPKPRDGNVQNLTTRLPTACNYKNAFFTLDFKLNTWKKVVSLNSPIFDISSVDGSRVLFRKCCEGDLFLVYLTDPLLTEKFVVSPTYNSNKIYSQATCIANIEIYFIGGRLKDMLPTNKVFTLNLITNEMERIPSMKVARCDASAILFKNCVYVLGGLDANEEMLRDVEMFDPARGEWSTMDSLKHARCGRHCRLFIYKEMLYVFGGESRDVECYDFSKDEWKLQVELLPLPIPRVCNALVINDQFIINSWEKAHVYRDRTEKQWLKLPDLPKF